jgi:hypothetical protein
MGIEMIRLSRRVDSCNRELPKGCKWLGISPPAHHGTRAGGEPKWLSCACIFAMLCPGVTFTLPETSLWAAVFHVHLVSHTNLGVSSIV